jgi:hypothetical protein
VSVSGGRAGVDSAWEQEKLEARKMLENAADRASEPPANIAQSKRIGACHPTRQVHALLARFCFKATSQV